MSDQFADGRRFRLLTAIDVFIRECLGIEIDTSLGGQRVCRLLDWLVAQWCTPERIGTDNGPEFRSKAMDQWAYENEAKLQFIPPGKPTKNAFIESFNAWFREDCLNQHYFFCLPDARTIVRDWIMKYNTIRPHGSLGKMTPAEYAGAQGRLQSPAAPSGGPGPRTAPQHRDRLTPAVVQ